MAGGILVFIAQCLLIAGLLVQRTRRRRAEERTRAILRAIPDLMFVLDRDGTYVDFHAHDPKQLFVPPDGFLGRRIRDVMPPELAELFMRALDRAFRTQDPIVIEYELSTSERRHFEARLVRAGDRHVLTI